MSAGVAAALSAGASAGLASWLLLDESVLARVRAEARRRRALAGGARASGRAAPPPGALDRLAPGWARALARRRREGAERADARARCLDELPELMDVVALGLSAGVSFDAALGIYCERYRTMLAGLLGDAMQSWRLGMASRREALGALSERLQVGAFTAFCETVCESVDLGAPLARTLVRQAETVRSQRRASVEEQIETAPVKMLVPTGALVLPAMLLSVMGPLLAALTVAA